MKKTIIIIFILFSFLNSCSNTKPETIESFKFAVYENKPVFEDEYLYGYETRKSVKKTYGKTEWYLLDWNNNGIFNEIGIDYYGVKSPFKNRPIVSILEETNSLNHNGITYSINEKTNFSELLKIDLNPENETSYISDFIPIELTDGTTLETNVLDGYDKTVIYFWATWCAPCINKLEEIETKKEQLKRNKINFIPIYYKCSFGDVVKLNKEKGLSFPPREVSNLTALSYQISALAEVYVFDKNGKLIAENFNLEEK